MEEMEKGAKEKEHCDQDGLLKSRRMGEHDDCTNVSFLSGYLTISDVAFPFMF